MQNPYSKIEKMTVFLEEKIMLNIAICDDDDLIAHQIESVLHNISDEEKRAIHHLIQAVQTARMQK